MKINLKNKINSKSIVYLLLILVILGALVASLILNPVKSSKKRRVYIFPSVENNAYITDVRYLSPVSGKSDVEVFISDLLLGSTVERTKMLFAKGTRLNSCFVRNGVVYLDLSEDLISADDEVIPIKQGMELLRQNVSHNFSDIKSVDNISIIVSLKSSNVDVANL